MQPVDARRAWQLLEVLNAVTYFADECRQAAKDVGLKGFWMGYFAFRAAPMGAVGPGVVAATFFNFRPSMPERALPDAWSFASPAEVLAAREASAAAALRRVAPAVDDVARTVNPTLDSVVAAGDPAGRPLFAANRDLGAADDPVEHLWRRCTTLREHRGDGHVACLTAEGIDGCQAHVLFAADAGVEPDLYQASRGWSRDEWDAAADRLRRRGLLEGDALSDRGQQVRESIERRTDELAIEPFHALGDREFDALLDVLRPAAAAVLASGIIPFPNPMGLPSGETAS